MTQSYDAYQMLFKDKTFNQVLQTEPMQLSGRASAFTRKVSDFFELYEKRGKNHTTVLEMYPGIEPYYTAWQELKSSIAMNRDACLSAQAMIDKQKDAKNKATEGQDIIQEVTELLARFDTKKDADVF